MNYEWYGNIRELLSVIERAAILSDGDEILPKDLFLDSRKATTNKVESLEKELLKEVLADCNNDVSKASQILGMSQEILTHKIAKYNL